MKYWIYAEGADEVEFALLLAKEIFRFDVRAQINGSDKFEGLEKHKLAKLPIKTYPECFIYVGGKPLGYKKLPNATRFFVSTNLSQVQPIPLKDKFYTAVPRNEGCYLGCYLNDLIKNYTFQNDDSSNEIHEIGLLLSNTKPSRLDHLIKKLNHGTRLKFILPLKYQDVKFGDYTIEFLSDLDLLKKSSVVILDNVSDSLKATLLNCPQIVVKSLPFWSTLFMKGEVNILNSLLNSDVFVNYSIKSIDNIVDTVNSTLNNHEAYASVLAQYQKIKNILGAELASRNIAKDIISNLESAS